MWGIDSPLRSVLKPDVGRCQTSPDAIQRALVREGICVDDDTFAVATNHPFGPRSEADAVNLLSGENLCLKFSRNILSGSCGSCPSLLDCLKLFGSTRRALLWVYSVYQSHRNKSRRYPNTFLRVISPIDGGDYSPQVTNRSQLVSARPTEMRD